MVSSDEFISSLHEEKILLIKERSRYVQLKIGFIIGILGLGTLGATISTQDVIGFNSSCILLVIPIVAIGYDHYIYGSDIGVKRIGKFIRENPCQFSRCEFEWEMFVIGKRQKYALNAALIFSLIATIFAGVLFFFFLNTLRLSLYYFLPAILYFLFFLCGIGYMYEKHRELIEKYDQTTMGNWTEMY
jgi:hypothetical protein